MFLERRQQVKIIKNRLFLNEKGEVIRIISVVKKSNIINIFNYQTYTTEKIDYDTAEFLLTPVFRIGELAKILDKKTDTIRKYELKGLLPKAKKISLNSDGTSNIRIYTLKDIYNLMEIFSMRNKSGRPSGPISIDRSEALRHINARFQKIKNVGT